MKWMGRWLVVVAVVFGALAPLALRPQSAFACYCLPREPEAHVVPEAVVFRGTVVEIVRSADGANGYVFKPSEVWQGEVGAQVHVYDVGGDCSARIHEGREYVVATGQDQWGDHRISSCHLVREVMGPLPDDLKFLGEPQMRFDTTWTPAADEPSIQRVPMRQGGYGVPPNWQAGGMNGGLQSDWKLALVAGGSLLAAAAVALVGRRT